MYDFDQKRSALPNSGSYYCVPTSYCDVFQYMAHYGMPGQDGGYGTGYSDMSSMIFTMGILMGTDPNKGTSFSNSWSVGNSWIFNHTSKLVYCYGYGPDWDWGTGTIKNVLKTGGVVVIGRGKYEWDGNDYDRVGGHAVVLVGYNYPSSGGKTITVCDPNDDANLNSQSGYVYVNKATSNLAIDTEAYGVVTHARYTNNEGTGNVRYVIDNMHNMLPMYAAWPYSGGPQAGTNFKFYWPFIYSNEHLTRTETISIPDVPVDWCLDAGEVGLMYLTASGDLHKVDLAEGSNTVIANVPDAKKLVVGGSTADIFVLRKPVLGADQIVLVDRDTGKKSSRATPAKMLDLDWDVQGNGVAMVSQDGGTIYRCDEKLGPIVTDKVLQIFSVPPDSMATLHFKVDHVSGDAILATEGSTTFQRFHRTKGKWVGRTVSYRGTGIQAIFPGERGLTFVQDAGKIWTLDSNGNYVDTDFSGTQVDGDFQITRSLAAFKPETMTGPGWDNVPPQPGEE